MRTYRNYTIEAVEQETIAYRARQLVHPTMTRLEFEDHQAHQMKVYHALLIGCAVLALVVVVMYAWVMR